jgi:choline-sulfatase
MRRSAAIALALTGMVSATACRAPEPAIEARSLLLVTFDTTRADRIGAYGYGPAETPNLDRLAADGVLFENAIAPAPITLPSHVSLLTGVYPLAHGVRDNGVFTLGPEATLLSEVLHGQGWRTGAFVASFVLDARFGLDQGFEVYRGARFSDETPGVIVERRADAVVDDVAAWLAGIEPGERFFAWVHFFDPHFPYDPPSPWRERSQDPYDGEIAFADSQLGRLLGLLERRGLAKGLAVAVTADHGESLGEHGEKSHGVFLYQSSLHVPLLISGDALRTAAGTRVTAPVSSADLPATLLALAGVPRSAMPELALPALPGIPGLAPSTETGSASDPSATGDGRSLLIETHYPYYAHRWHALRGVVWGGAKLVQGRESELYDLDRDPGEVRNRAAEDPARTETLSNRLSAELAAHPALGWARPLEGADAERARLEALGYVLAQLGGDPFDPSLPDARERLGDADRQSEAYDRLLEALALDREPAGAAWQQRERAAERARLLGESRALLLAVREANPRDPEAMRQLALVETHLENHAEAIALFEALVAERPGEVQQIVNLAINYQAVGRSDDAARAMLRANQADPRHPRPYRWLAAHHRRGGDLAAAMTWLGSALETAELDDESRAQIERDRAALGAETDSRASADPERLPASGAR